MLNVARLSTALGTRVLARFGGVRVWVIVEDVRKVWNRVDLLVRPESGEGSEWISMDRLCKVPESSALASV